MHTCTDVLDTRGHIVQTNSAQADMAKHFEESLWLMSGISGAEAFFKGGLSRATVGGLSLRVVEIIMTLTWHNLRTLFTCWILP